MAQYDGAIVIDLQLQQDDFEKRLDQLEGKTSKFGSKIKGALAALGIAKIGKDFISAGVNYNIAMENYTAGLTTLLGSADKAEKMIADLKKYAAATPFEMSDLSSATQTLLSFGVAEKDVMGTMKMLGDVSLGDQQKFQSLALVFGQVSSQGKLMGQDLLQMINAGFNPLQTISDKTGESMASLKDKMSKGQIGIDEVTQAFQWATSEGGKFYGGMERGSKTLSGQMSTLKDNFNEFAGNAVAPLTNALSQKLLPAIIGLFNGSKNIDEVLNILGSLCVDAISAIATGFPELLKSGSKMLAQFSQGIVEGLPDFVETVLMLIQSFADSLAENAPSIIQNGFEMLSNLVQGIINAIPIMIKRLPQIITTFANIINDNFPTILAKGAELLWQLITGIIGAIPTLIANIPQIIEAIVSTIMAFEWLNLGKNIINFFGDGIGSMVAFVKSKGKDIFNAVIEWLKNLPTKLWNMAKEAISNFGKSITNTTGTVKGAISGVFNAVVNGIKTLPSKMLEIGSNIVKGLWNGISNVTGWIKSKISGFVDDIVGGIKDFFGIHSPSTVMRDMIGKYLPPGIAIGFEMAMPKSIQNMGSEIDSMTAGLQRRIDMNMNDMSASAYLEGNVKVTRNSDITNAFPKSVKMEGGQDVYLVTEDGTELAHWIAPFIDKELKFD